MTDFKVIETQEDFDRAIQARLSQKDREVTARFKDYLSPDDVQGVKADYEKRLEEANKRLEEITAKLADHDQEVAKLTARAVSAETDLLKGRVAHEKGVPLELAGRLVGETREDLEKDAETFASFLTPKSAPPLRTSEPGKGASTTDAALASMLSQINSMN